MPCTRGCCPTQRDHYRSLLVARSPEDRARMTKTTTDDHGTHTVDVTEHYTDRQDVTVHAPLVQLRGAARTPGA